MSGDFTLPPKLHVVLLYAAKCGSLSQFPHAPIMATTTGYNQMFGSTPIAQRASAPAQILNACVLVVENDEDTRFLLRIIVERHGATVVEAVNGEMAIALAENVHLDLILMDGSLPLLDGFEATRRIRELTAAREVPIVFLSGHAQPAAKVKAFAAGCTDYFVKPFDFSELGSVLERHLSQSNVH
ncbi:MAG: response regulator [Rubrivivax sp.]|nr:response regulator [Pyrinomonadaceae bacterium]